MRSKLGIFCEKLIEAGWLAAVVIVPTLFSVYTDDRFAVNKACLVRALALVMSLAWVLQKVEGWRMVRAGETGFSFRRRVVKFLARPLILPALLMVSITILSSLTSIWPHGSFWGTYDRRQGAYTTLSYIAISLLTLRRLRTEQQLARLARLVVVGSLPVCLYALAEHYDPMAEPFAGQFDGRISSSLGNPIFLAGYLIMVVPVTMRQLILAFRSIVAGGKNLLSGLVMTGSYCALLLVQLYVVLLTQSRGPFLALLVGLVFFFVLWALQEDRRDAAMVVLGVAVLAASLLIAVNLSDNLADVVGDLPYVSRMSSLVGARSLEQRILIWQGAVELSSQSPVRFLLGYGPESMDLAFYGHYPLRLVELSGPEKTADRSHNAILDVLVNSGLVGSTVYLFLFCSVFYYGLRALGMVDDGRQRRIFAAVLGGGGIVGLLISWLVGGPGFVGVGLSAGLLAGLLAYAALVLAGVVERRVTRGSQQLLVIALVSAVVGHFVEIQVGIPVTVTRLYFWVFAGVLALALTSLDAEAQRARRDARPHGGAATPAVDDESMEKRGDAHRSGSAGRPKASALHVLPSALMVGLLLISTALGLVTHASDRGAEPFIVVFLLLVWLPAGLLVVGETGTLAPREQGANRWINRTVVYAVASQLSLLVFGLPYLLVLRRFPAVTSLPLVYYLALSAALVGAGLALLGDSPLPDRFWRDDVGWFYPILALVALGLVMAASVNLVRADVCFYLGRLYERADRWDESVAFYERAVGFAPAQDHYYRFLGHAYLKNAQLNTPDRPAWFGRAEETLERAVQISPLNPDHRGNLGNLYHAWADVTEQPGLKVEKLRMALAHYQESVSLAPQTHGRLLEDAIFEARLSLATALGRLGQMEDAVEEARAARNVAPTGREQEAEELIAAMEAREQ